MYKLTTWLNSSSGRRIILSFGSLVFCLLFLMRHQVLNGFSILTGDRYDGVISTTILEHWFRFFQGAVEWTEVGYFFPDRKTIANTDAYFLNGLAYIPFRLIGFDVFLSSELSNLIIKSIGFLGAFLLCRKVLLFGFYWSLLVAILFTLSNGMTAHSSRIQLATVAFFPVMALLLWSMTYDYLSGNLARFRISGIVTGVFYGAWCLTCFYMAFFFLLYATVFVSVIIFSVGNYRAMKEGLIANWRSLFIVFIAALASLAPFISAFLPKARETGVRVYEEALRWTVPPEEILQVGTENYLWGTLYNFLLTYILPSYAPTLHRDYREYYNTGFSIGIFSLFIMGCVKILKSRRELRTNANEFIIWSLTITTIITWLLIININGKSAWFFVFHFFPGAKALRVVSSYQIFLALPVIIIAIKYLSSIRLSLIVAVFTSALLIAEEFNKPILLLDHAKELDRISLPLLPPKECHSFYVSGWEKQENLGFVGNLYAHNVTAMLVSQYAEIPTINGVASFNPPGFNLNNPNSSDYDLRVHFYAKKHQVSDLCKLDLNSKRWAVIPSSDIDLSYMYVPFFIESNWSGHIYDVQGLDGSEEWGAWSIGNNVVFEFNAPLPEKFDLHLIARAFGPNVGKEFLVDVGGSLSKFRFTDSTYQKKIISIDNRNRSRLLKINIPDPTSPKSFSNGESIDDRTLGISFFEMKIVAR